ncbi:hypothetical protein MSAN_01626600 [Mycena sanguinolenta]|uniref:AB hydrolase-1 domain-containing protein n=1 Tax=Mycena sanguinolenta TaxID=230812 RepID=A0A8H6Y283_9AGAR|nr:hypothetical protein MSAN_01626600 [Mycena sanguinolenta]
MRRSVLTLKPNSEGTASPFYVEAIQYVPEESFDHGFTLIFMHAVNLHKETFEPMLQHLFKQTSGVRIRDVWCIENPNQGRSACLNHKLLSTPKYRDHWTAAEYARAVHSFLTSDVHGVDFTARKLIAAAHSGAAPALLLVQDQMPKNIFHGLIFLDPAIFPSGKACSRVVCELFEKLAKSKRHTWDSRETAVKELSTTTFKRWDPLCVQLFVKNALHPSADDFSVTLACSPMQEAGYYLSPDWIERPFEIFTQLTAADQLPIHLIICLRNKSEIIQIFETQIALVKNMTKGSVQVVEGGHMFPQTEPVLCADAIVQVLSKLQYRESARL